MNENNHFFQQTENQLSYCQTISCLTFSNSLSQEFYADHDISSVDRKPLYPAIFARFIVIKPKMCTGNCSLRVEFYGQFEGNFAIHIEDILQLV